MNQSHFFSRAFIAGVCAVLVAYVFATNTSAEGDTAAGDGGGSGIASGHGNAHDGLNRKEYGGQFALQDNSSRYWPDVQACLGNWGEHPFKQPDELRFRVIDPDLKLFGLGGNVVDTAQTSYPQLIYIRPAVSVMSKATYELMNENGWYCFKAKVNVMSKSIIKTGCNTHVATTKGRTTVLGKGEDEKKGTTVMGKSVVERTCD